MDPVAALVLGGLLIYAILSGAGPSSSTSTTTSSSPPSSSTPTRSGSSAASQTAAARARAQSVGAAPSDAADKAEIARLKGLLAQQTKTTPRASSTPAAPLTAKAAANTIGNTALTTAAPVITYGAGQVLKGAGQAVATGQVNMIAPGSPTGVGAFGPSSYDGSTGNVIDRARAGAGNVLDTAGGTLGSVTPLAGVFAVSAYQQGFRGKSKKQQAAILGQSAVKTTQFALGYVPIFGAGLAAGAGVLAGTYEGKRLVKATGVAAEQGYQFQKKLVSGDVAGAFSGGGSSHRERVLRAIEASTPQTVQNNAQLARQDAAAVKLATDIADGKGKPGDVSSVTATRQQAAVNATKTGLTDADFMKQRDSIQAKWDSAMKAAGVNAGSLIGARNDELTAFSDHYFVDYTKTTPTGRK